MIYLRYLFTVIWHKWFMMIECCKEGIPKRGLLHDMSKFHKDEFVPYARYFEGDSERYKNDFKSACLCHEERNPHHWEYWVISGEEGEEWALQMDSISRLEMVCDWRGASKSYKGDTACEYYLRKRNKIILHPETRAWIEDKLGVEKSRTEAR